MSGATIRPAPPAARLASHLLMLPTEANKPDFDPTQKVFTFFPMRWERKQGGGKWNRRNVDPPREPAGWFGPVAGETGSNSSGKAAAGSDGHARPAAGAVGARGTPVLLQEQVSPPPGSRGDPASLQAADGQQELPDNGFPHSRRAKLPFVGWLQV